MHKTIPISLFSKINPRGTLAVGNALDHYDTALYGFLAPLLAPLFFPSQDPWVALIMAYSLMSSSILMAPLGGYLWSKWAKKYGCAKVLRVTLLGVGLGTCAMGFLPLYGDVGAAAPLSLAFLRALQGFFAAGEKVLSAQVLVQVAPENQQGRASALYHTSSMAGILLASCVAWGVTASSSPHLWRLAFMAAALTAFLALFLRQGPWVTMPPISPQKTPFSWRVAAHIFSMTGLSYSTYAIPFILMNGLMPLISDLTKVQMLEAHTWLMVGDMLLLPFMGRWADRMGVVRQVRWSLAVYLLSLPFLMMLLPQASWMMALGVRLVIVFLGIAMAAPLQAYWRQLYGDARVLQHYGVASALGAEILGRSLPAMMLALYHSTGSILLMTGPVILAGLGALFFNQGRGRP